MAFVNSLFPNPRLVSDLQVGYTLPTTIVGSGSSEYRIQKLQNWKKKWTWPSRAMSTTDRRNIQTFITDVAKFSLNSFLFQDPDNNTWNNVQLLSTGAGNTFYLTERGGADVHPIFHPHTDIIVKLAGSTVATTFSIATNGRPVLTVPGATTSSVVTISGTFFYAARYDSADFNLALTVLKASGIGSGSTPAHDTVDAISLIEVFE